MLKLPTTIVIVVVIVATLGLVGTTIVAGTISQQAHAANCNS